MNLQDLDPNTLMPSPELDALIAEKWMGWVSNYRPEPGCVFPVCWSLSNPAHAGEARRKADESEVSHSVSFGQSGCFVTIEGHEGFAPWSDPDDKGPAEALATCRAIVAAMQAEERG